MNENNVPAQADPYAHTGQFLCYAWGESDWPVAAIVADRAGVRQFIIDHWLGEEDATDFDGTPTLPGLMEEFDAPEWDMQDTLEWTFEIGGVRITKVYDVAAAPVAQPPATGEALRDVIERTAQTIERQLELIGERAPGNFLDKRPVVQSLSAHVKRLRAALATPPAPTTALPPVARVPLSDDQIWSSWIRRPEIPDGEDDSMERQIHRALLEKAAKAAGLVGDWSKTMGGWDCLVIDGGQPWQPLHDDGDALRLAVKLGLLVDAGAHTASDGGPNRYGQVGGRDPYAATRRAIVRAAAALAPKDTQ